MAHEYANAPTPFVYSWKFVDGRSSSTDIKPIADKNGCTAHLFCPLSVPNPLKKLTPPPLVTDYWKLVTGFCSPLFDNIQTANPLIEFQRQNNRSAFGIGGEILAIVHLPVA